MAIKPPAIQAARHSSRVTVPLPRVAAEFAIEARIAVGVQWSEIQSDIVNARVDHKAARVMLLERELGVS